jgi:hypothetical protein
MRRLPILLGAAAWLAAVAAHAAPTNHALARAADPNAPVPPTPYVKALPYQPPASPRTSADQNWKALNRIVAEDGMQMSMDAPEPGKQEHMQHHHEEGK